MVQIFCQFSDGITRAIGRRTRGITYLSANESVITVNVDGVLRLVGNGETILTVKNRDQEATLSILIQADETPNGPPVSDAGNPQTVSA